MISGTGCNDQVTELEKTPHFAGLWASRSKPEGVSGLANVTLLVCWVKTNGTCKQKWQILT